MNAPTPSTAPREVWRGKLAPDAPRALWRGNLAARYMPRVVRVVACDGRAVEVWTDGYARDCGAATADLTAVDRSTLGPVTYGADDATRARGPYAARRLTDRWGDTAMVPYRSVVADTAAPVTRTVPRESQRTRHTPNGRAWGSGADGAASERNGM